MNVFVWNSGFEFDPIQLESETRIVLPYAREGRMPPKRYQSRFPTARIKKIMQLDDDVGKVASSVPLLISRAVEMFLQKMLTSSADYVGSRTSKTITASHMKYVINNDPLFHFLREEVAKVPDVAEASEEQEDGRKKRGRYTCADAFLQL
jgi:histone H3/H4